MPKKTIIFFILSICLFLCLSNLSVVSNAQFEEAFGTSTLVRFSENFDGVASPQIPNGWTVSTTGTGAGFVTISDNPDTSPNTIFSPSPNSTSSATLTSPPIFILGSNTRLNFRHKYSLETTWDGAVLEIKIGDGQFVDIQDAGGVFLTGGYNSALNPSTNPLSNRFAWSGANQGNFADVSVKLPASSFRQTVQFRWILGTNNSFGANGWRIDTVKIEEVPTGLNSNSITIADNNPAMPYPSNIQITGQQGLISGIVVNIENLSHTSPDDVDILLVSPTGRSVVLMSDVGGNEPINNVTLTFDDFGSSNLPDNSIISSGVYKPTNFEENDNFPSPAPQTSHGSGLNAFYGDVPNGIWSLFVVDDNGNNVGNINNGWNLSVQSSVNACFFTVNPLFTSFSHLGGNSNFTINSPVGCPWSATVNNGFIHFNSTSQNSINGTGSALVEFNVDENFGAGRTGLITISDGFTSRTFQIQQSSGCPFSLAQNSLNFSSTGGSGNVAVTAGGTCVWNTTAGANWIEITSTQNTGDGNLTFNVLPNTTGIPRTTSITIGARTLTINQLATSNATRFDFDGDGKSDLSVYRNGVWYLQQSSAGSSVTQFGLATDNIAPADYDGDGKTDFAVFREGIWYILQSSNSQVLSIQFGQTGDIIVPADFDNDGRSELAVYRNGTWFTNNLATNQTATVQFGLAGDKPVTADYDGDGRADQAVYRNGVWYILRSNDGFTAVQFGIATDIPVVGDYNGDGKSDLAVYRNGIWHILTNFQNYSVSQFGIATDKPVAADYDGDGKTDLAVYREGIWYIMQSSSGQFSVSQFGLANDKPIPNAFVP